MDDSINGAVSVSAQEEIKEIRLNISDPESVKAWADGLTREDLAGGMPGLVSALNAKGVSEMDASIITAAGFNRFCELYGNKIMTSAKFKRAARESAHKEASKAAADAEKARGAITTRTCCTDCPVDAATGTYMIDYNTGLTQQVTGPNGIKTNDISYTPIVVREILKNAETDKVSAVLAYFDRDRGEWRDASISKESLGDPDEIYKVLGGYPVDITRRNAGDIANYLVKMIYIPTNRYAYTPIPSVSHVGWTADCESCAPYAGPARVDATSRTAQYYTVAGDAAKSLTMLRDMRAYNDKTRIFFDAVLTSLIIFRTSGLTEVVTPTGVTSGGKTLILNAAASMFGSPRIVTKDSTYNGLESMMATASTLPAFFDDASASKSITGAAIYKICTGEQKVRLTTSGDVRKNANDTPWQCVLAMGCEHDITSESSTGGEDARVFSIPEDSGKKWCNIDKAADYAETCKNNYGHVAKMIADYLIQPGVLDKVHDDYVELNASMDKGINGKQRAFGAAVVIMSRIADSVVWHAGNPVTVEEVSRYMKKSKDIDDGDKTIELLKSWIVSNNMYVSCDNRDVSPDANVIDGGAKIYATQRMYYGKAYMVVLLDALSIFAKQYGYSDARAVARSVAEAGHALRDDTRNTNFRRVSVNGAKVKGLWVRWDDGIREDFDTVEAVEEYEQTATPGKTENAENPATVREKTETIQMAGTPPETGGNICATPVDPDDGFDPNNPDGDLPF